MMTVKTTPSFSVVINTNGRRESLQRTIESFRHVNYPSFELCVVYGPSSDGTEELVKNYEQVGAIRSAACSELNLSQSRNIGIAMASGDIVAFIDDDAIAEPEWLEHLATAFDEEDVAAAGGKVLDPSGYTHQYLYSACDRLGNARLDLTKPASEYNFPFSNLFPYVQGTNAAFRRSTLVDIGGFDEEYEFYLDETDVCCRVIDAGLNIRQLPNAVVHHKYLPSHLRNTSRITTVRYAVLKNKIYFSLINNHGHFSLDETISDAIEFVRYNRTDLERHIAAKRLDPIVLESFELEVERAWNVGLRRGLSGQRRTRPAEFFDVKSQFCQFPFLIPPESRRTFVFLSQNYPPADMDGVARYTQDIAQAVGARGHLVHVITRGTEDNPTVELEDNVWVHRMPPKHIPPRFLPSGTLIPQHIVNQSGTALEEVYKIARSRPVHVIEGTSWDGECIVPQLDGRFSTVTNVVTTLSHWLETHQNLRNDTKWMADFGNPMLETERHLFQRCPGIIAASQAIARSVEQRYDLKFASSQIGYLKHGSTDMSALPRQAPLALAASSTKGPKGKMLRVLFVGRLELRKGIDILLDAAKQVLKEHNNVEFWVAGDDTIVLDTGFTAKETFYDEAEKKSAANVDRVHFLGRVTDEELRWLYSECDIYAAPSRYESFGLILTEAMMFGKPSIAARIGGMAEVLQDGIDGLFCEPENALSLTTALNRLILDPKLRLKLGRQGRKSFENKLEISRVVADRVRFLSSFAREPVPQSAIQTVGVIKPIEVGLGETALGLGEGTSLILAVQAKYIHITFWSHPWSGIAEVWVNGTLLQEIDLYSNEGGYRTATIAVPGSARSVCQFRLHRPGRRQTDAYSDEVILHSISSSNPSPNHPDSRYS